MCCRTKEQLIKTAVIVDDEPLSCELIKNLVQSFNLPLSIAGVAHSGDEALELITRLRPDLVFLDIELPVFSGLEIMRKLRSFHGSQKIIVITAYDYFEYAQQALRLGAKDILLKPVDSAQFIEMMGRVLGTRLTGNKMFNEILEYISSNIASNLTLNECAKMFHTSPNYLSRLFIRYTNSTFISYVNEQRINRAVELLQNSEYTVSEIAAMVGFNSLNYFYKKFGALTGTTPKTYRR